MLAATAAVVQQAHHLQQLATGPMAALLVQRIYCKTCRKPGNLHAGVLLLAPAAGVLPVLLILTKHLL
jgi:hypothetical protein